MGITTCIWRNLDCFLSIQMIKRYIHSLLLVLVLFNFDFFPIIFFVTPKPEDQTSNKTLPTLEVLEVSFRTLLIKIFIFTYQPLYSIHAFQLCTNIITREENFLDTLSIYHATLALLVAHELIFFSCFLCTTHEC